MRRSRCRRRQVRTLRRDRVGLQGLPREDATPADASRRCTDGRLRRSPPAVEPGGDRDRRLATWRSQPRPEAHVSRLGGNALGIHTVNILLTLVTLGFYRFWGKVNIRRYILSQTAFEGDRFGYHGTGKELLLGFVKALLFVGLPIAAISWAGQLTEDTLIQVGARLLTSSLVMVFIPIAIVGARRYRLSRTSW